MVWCSVGWCGVMWVVWWVVGWVVTLFSVIPISERRRLKRQWSQGKQLQASRQRTHMIHHLGRHTMHTNTPCTHTHTHAHTHTHTCARMHTHTCMHTHTHTHAHTHTRTCMHTHTHTHTHTCAHNASCTGPPPPPPPVVKRQPCILFCRRSLLTWAVQ